MTISVTHRMCSQAHRLMTTGNKEIHLWPTINRIMNLHLRIGERDFKEESPKRVRANDKVTKYQVNQMGGDVQRRNSPKSSTIHINLRTENTLFLYIRSIELLAVYLITKM